MKTAQTGFDILEGIAMIPVKIIKWIWGKLVKTRKTK